MDYFQELTPEAKIKLTQYNTRESDMKKLVIGTRTSDTAIETELESRGIKVSVRYGGYDAPDSYRWFSNNHGRVLYAVEEFRYKPNHQPGRIFTAVITTRPIRSEPEYRQARQIAAQRKDVKI